MSSLSRVRGAAVAVSLLLLALTGCATAEAAPTPPPEVPTPTPTPTIERVIGQSALPLGCAELLTPADVAGVVPELRYVIDETHLLPRGDELAAAQSGALFCGWGDAGYRGTGWSNSIEVRVSATTETTIAPDPNDYGVPLVPVDAALPTSVGACTTLSETNYCRLVQLRSGYRVELQVWADVHGDAAIRATADALLERVGSAIDAAGPMRVVAQPAGTSQPTALCSDAQVWSIVTARGAAGEPAVSTWPATVGDLVTTTCAWTVPDPWGGDPVSVTVEVLPGGAWALPSIGGSIGMYQGTPAEGYLVLGAMDGIGAVRAIGDDLVLIWAPTGETDPAAWEQLLDATW